VVPRQLTLSTPAECGAGHCGSAPRPVRRGPHAAAPEIIDWRKGGESNAQGLRSPVFETGAVASRLALPYGPPGRYRTCTSGVSGRRADFYATDGETWSDREDSNLHRLCIRQKHSTVVLRSAAVGPKGFEPLSACYKQAALTVELRASLWWAGEDSHLYSDAALLQSAGLAHSQPAHRCCHGDSNPDRLLGRQARLSVTPRQRGGPAGRSRTCNQPIKSRQLCLLELRQAVVPPEGLEPPSPRLKGAYSAT
jgi:hypothetical protein